MALGARYSMGQNQIGDWYALLAQLRDFWGPMLTPAGPDTPFSLVFMWLDHFDRKSAHMHVDCCDDYGAWLLPRDDSNAVTNDGTSTV